MAIKHFENDLPFPDDREDEDDYEGGGTATATKAVKVVAHEQSPLDAEPATKFKPSRPLGKRKIKEYEEEIPAEDHSEKASSSPVKEKPSEFDPGSPLDALEDASLLMVEVERIGPGTGKGWVQRMFDHGDGRGPQTVSYSRVGSFLDGRGIVDRIQAETGGGEYRFARKGKKPVTMVLSGPPLPLPPEQQAQAAGQTTMFSGYNPQPGLSYDVRDEGYQQEYQRDPFGHGYDPEVGIDPEEITASGLNGWFKGGPYNKIVYYINGVPSRPPRGAKPPAALLGTPGFAPQSFDPGLYDHSADGKTDPRLDKLEELVKMLVTAPSKNPMDDFLKMQQIQREEDRDRRDVEREQERIRREDEKDKERIRREDEREDRRERAKQESEDRREAARLSAEAAKSNGETAREVARLQSEAMKANSSSATEAAKEMAKMQAESSKQLVQILMSKNEEGGLDKALQRSMDLAEMMNGNKSGGLASEISTAVQEAAPALAGAVRDSIYAFKGVPLPQEVQAQTATSTQQAAQQGPTAEQQAIVSNLSLVGYLVSGWRAKSKPSAALLMHGALAFGLLDEYDDIAKKIQFATPAMIVSQFEQGTAALGNPTMFVNHLSHIKQMATDPAGQKWFADLQQALKVKPIVAQVVPPVAIAAPVTTTEEAAAKAVSAEYLKSQGV